MFPANRSNKKINKVLFRNFNNCPHQINTASLNQLILLAGQKGNFDYAKQVYNEAISNTYYRPDSDTFFNMIKVAGKHRDVGYALRVYGRALKAGMLTQQIHDELEFFRSRIPIPATKKGYRNNPYSFFCGWEPSNMQASNAPTIQPATPTLT